MSDTLKATHVLGRLLVQVDICIREHGGFRHGNAVSFCEPCNQLAREALALLSEAEAPRGRCAVCDTSAWDCGLMSRKCCSECRHPITAPPAAAAPAPTQGQHGRDCPKVTHFGGGYLHDANDDRPYDVDGVLYCGRCHGWMGMLAGEPTL